MKIIDYINEGEIVVYAFMISIIVLLVDLIKWLLHG
jgi:hypothetical protein